MAVSEKVKQFIKKYVYLVDESGGFAEFYRKANQFLTPEEIGSMGSVMNNKETLSEMSEFPQYFMYASDISNIYIPGNIVHIGEDAFSDCHKLSGVILGHGVQTIGSYAFFGCENLRTMFISDTVKNIEAHAFDKCPLLTIQCHKETYGEEYAKAHHIKCEYVSS